MIFGLIPELVVIAGRQLMPNYEEKPENQNGENEKIREEIFQPSLLKEMVMEGIHSTDSFHKGFRPPVGVESSERVVKPVNNVQIPCEFGKDVFVPDILGSHESHRKRIDVYKRQTQW